MLRWLAHLGTSRRSLGFSEKEMVTQQGTDTISMGFVEETEVMNICLIGLLTRRFHTKLQT